MLSLNFHRFSKQGFYFLQEKTIGVFPNLTRNIIKPNKELHTVHRG